MSKNTKHLHLKTPELAQGLQRLSEPGLHPYQYEQAATQVFASIAPYAEQQAEARRSDAECAGIPLDDLKQLGALRLWEHIATPANFTRPVTPDVFCRKMQNMLRDELREACETGSGAVVLGPKPSVRDIINERGSLTGPGGRVSDIEQFLEREDAYRGEARKPALPLEAVQPARAMPPVDSDEILDGVFDKLPQGAADCIAQHGADPAEQVANNQAANLVRGFMKEHLTPREDAVLARRFGFEDGQGQTRGAVAADDGVSATRTGTLEAHALAKLRAHAGRYTITARNLRLMRSGLE